MPDVLIVSSTGLNFGPVAPGTFGPDITATPPGFSSAGGFESRNVPSGANVVASIVGDTLHFQLRDVCVLDWVWETVGSGELPPGHKGPPPRIKVLEIVDQSDGVTPLAIQAGQSLLVRVQYAALSTEGTFTATLVIQGDAWAPISEPLSLFLAEVRTSAPTDPVEIVQGQQSVVPITIHSLYGPDEDVSYEMSRTQLDTGLSLQPNLTHVGAKASATASLTLVAAVDAPLGPNDVAIDQLAFGRHGFFVPVDILPPQPPRPVPPSSGPACVFGDPPGSPTLSPRAYGLINGKTGLVTAGVIKKKQGKKDDRSVTGFVANKKYQHFFALQTFLRESTDVSDVSILTTLRKAGTLRVVALSGMFTGAVETKVDLLVVGGQARGEATCKRGTLT